MTPDQLLAFATSDLGQALVAFATTLAGTAVQYRRTGRIPLAGLPWRALRRTLYAVRRRWFTVPRPDTTQITVTETSLDDIHDRLAAASFNPGWPLSYHYYGEDLNTRRYYYDPTRPYPHRQLHIRGFETTDDTVELVAHEEPAPEHHPRAHLKEVDRHDATSWLETAWADGEFNPQRFQRH